MGAQPGFRELFLSELDRLGAGTDREVVFLDRVDSTSTDLRRRLEAGSFPGTVVAAREQDAGKGRKGNEWYSPPGGNLYVSLAVEVAGESERASLLPLASGVAAHDAVEHTARVEANLKWPNDLLISGRKLAGILCEMLSLRGLRAVAIVGLGVNILTSDFPEELSELATSLFETTKAPPPAAVLAARWVSELEQWIPRIDTEETDLLVEAWRKRAEPWGRRVRVSGFEGRTLDLDRLGRLVIIQDSGEKVTVAGGAVEYL